MTYTITADLDRAGSFDRTTEEVITTNILLTTPVATRLLNVLYPNHVANDVQVTVVDAAITPEH